MRKFYSVGIAVALISCLSACSKTSTSANKSVNGTAFTNEQLLTALRSASLRMRLQLADNDDIIAISSSSDPTGAYASYTAAVDRYVDSADLSGALKIYFRQMFGMGSDATLANDDPANLAIYVILNDRPYSELFTANYKIVSGLPATGQDSGTPLAALGGFATLKNWLTKWYGNGFGFNFVRELARIGECYKYPPEPGSVSASGAWDVDTISPKYQTDPSTGFPCFECHQTLNPRREPFFVYGSNGTYNAGRDISDAEPNGFNDPPQPVVEPRKSGIKPRFLRDFVEDQNGRPAVGDFMKQITETESFKECTARRFISFALGYESAGTAGNNLSLPFDFKGSSKPGDPELLQKWTGIMEGNQLVIRPFLKAFFSDADFILRVSGVSL